MQYILTLFTSQKSLKISPSKNANHEISSNRTLNQYNFSSKSLSWRMGRQELGVGKGIRGERGDRGERRRLKVGDVFGEIGVVLGHCYGEQQRQFYRSVYKYLKKAQTSQHKQLGIHLNKLSFLQPSLPKQTPQQLQLQILKQWKKSPILQNIRLMWYQEMEKKKGNFEEIEEFGQCYGRFWEFVWHVVGIYFGGFFGGLGTRKAKDLVVHKVITHTSSWSRLFQQVLRPLIQQQLPPPNPNLPSFNPKSLQISPYAVNPSPSPSSPKSFPKTKSLLHSFLTSHNLPQKLSHLLTLRPTLQSQIQSHQSTLIKNNQLKSYHVLDKDDFIGCLILCVVEEGIEVGEVGVALREVQVGFGGMRGVMGEGGYGYEGGGIGGLEEVLGGVQGFVGYVDLRAVYLYLVGWNGEEQNND